MAETAVFTFGRMNPPTIGHKKLVDKVSSVAKTANADSYIFLSHSQDKEKNPLSYRDKLSIAKNAFGNIVKLSNAKTVIQVLKELEKKHKHVIMVVGSDRVQEFTRILNTYNGKDFNFVTVEVQSAGERDPDGEGVSGMSASKMREAASKNDLSSFKSGLPNNIRTKAKAIMDKVRSGLNINEQLDISEGDLQDLIKDIDLNLIDDEDLEDLGIDMVKFLQDMDNDEEDELNEVSLRKPLSVAQRMKKARIMKRLAPKLSRMRRIRKKMRRSGERLVFTARRQAVQLLRKRVAGKMGEKYRSLSPAQKMNIDKLIMRKRPMISKLAQRLMPKVRRGEQDRLKKARNEDLNLSFEQYLDEVKRTPQDKDIADKKGTQPAKYHRGLKPTTKAARDSQFKKQTKMDDNNPAAYKDAPGDKAARKKGMPLSKYTRMYRQTYGEEASMDSEAQKDYNTPAAVHKAEKTYPRFAALTDLDLNTKNRNETIKEYSYGPANPGDEEGSKLFWDRKADLWNAPLDQVKSMRCNNCNAFNQTEEVKRRMADALGPKGRTIVKNSMLGYCEFFEFKCAGNRTCDAWVGGGPITESENLNRVSQQHKIEKERLKVRHDRQKDRARLADTRATNAKTEARGRPKKGTSDDEGIENIQMQLRKVMSLRGQKPVEFENGKKMKMDPKDASDVLDMINKTKMPAKKLEIVRYIAKSPENMKHVIAGKPIVKRDPFSLKGLLRSKHMNFEPAPAYDMYRTSYITGSVKKASNMNEAFEEFCEALKKDKIHSYSTYVNDPTKSPLSSVVPRNNFMLEKAKEGLKKKAAKTGISYATLKKVYDRGVAAWRTGHRPGTTPSQWGYGRVNAFIAKRKKGNLDHDKDLAHFEPQGNYIEEVSSKTLGSYISKASDATKHRSLPTHKVDNRYSGVAKAQDKLAKSGMMGTTAQKVSKAKVGASEDQQNEKIYMRTDPKLKNLKVPVNRKKGKILNRKTGKFESVNEETNHEITVGDYTTKFFHMCGSAQEVMKKHANKEGAEDLTKAQDMFYKLEKEIMNSGSANDMQKNKAKALYAMIIKMAENMGIKNEVDKYMKMHLDSVIKGDPKLGFGRTDISESYKGNEIGTDSLVKKYKDMTPGYEQFTFDEKHGGEHQSTGRKMTDAEMKKREKIKKGLMKSKSDFKKRYGGDADQVMNALATKRAMGEENDSCCDDCDNHFDHVISEATYQGKTVKLNDPIRTSEVPTKKFKVYVKDGDKVKVVRFGDPNLSIKRDNPDRRKSFRARHNCDNPGPKTKPRYWACFQWRSGSKVDN